MSTVEIESPKAKASTRVALVTGGAMGIGAAIVERLVRDGATVIVADRDAQASDKLVASLDNVPGRAIGFQVDVGDAQAIANAFDRIESTFGRCDILVNNAGIAKTYPFCDFPVDNWQATMNVNVTGPLLLSQRAARMMMKHKWGRIINIASISGVRASVGRTAYGTSKAAVMGLTRQMAIELAQYGITANCVAPGPIETPLVQSVHSQASRDAYLRMLPMQRYGLPNEIAGAVSFLASEDSSYITGQTLAVDGGFTIAGILDL